jgi:arsenate reductase (glutaredoxin)
MTALLVYGIPTCSTCKRALNWLDAHAIAYTFIDTRQTPPSAAMIGAWVQTLGSKAMRNTSGQAYRNLDASRSQWDDARWIAEFAREPMLLKRPLFVRDNQAIMVGFRGDDEAIARSLN